MDAAAANHPIKLTHRSGRAHVLNSLALKLARISRETANSLPEGQIDRDVETGEPTGLLYGMNDYLAEMIPRIDREAESNRVSSLRAGNCARWALPPFTMPRPGMIFIDGKPSGDG